MKHLLSLLILIACASHTLAAERPNIIFIFADDWGWGDLGCHGHPYVKTPNIDRLAKEGTDFHRFSVASGVCSPSRTAVMTGHFPARYGIDGHFAQVEVNQKRNMPDWLNPEAPLLTRFLQQAGYATAHYGKWHLSNDMIPDSPLLSAYGIDDYGAFNCAGPQMFVHDDVKSAISFIDRCHSIGKPFFINLWIHEPHTPFHVDPEYLKKFPELDKPDAIYAATLLHADERIGQLLDTLDQYGLTEKTLVIFSSDNGPARSEKPIPLELTYDSATGLGYGLGAAKGITGGRREHKGSLMEGGIGVPFIARWPGHIPAGRIDNSTILSAVDLLPTLCEIAGAQIPEDYHPDGTSQTAALLGQESTLRTKPLFWRMPSYPRTYASLNDRWKMISNKDLTSIQLFDIVSDPLESNDLAGEKPDVVQDLTPTPEQMARHVAKITCWPSFLIRPQPGQRLSNRLEPRVIRDA